MKLLSAFWMFVLTVTPAFCAQVPDTVFLEELTWTEVRDAIRNGKTTIIFPTGGTEQNGPHMVLGKHNFIVKHAAEQIARRLGNALVAPVLAYVPEGNIDPPSGHMQYPGTITLPEEFFMKVAEYASRSFKVHGFRDIVLIGDSGPNQRGLQAVARMLNQEWSATDVRVHHVPEYYRENGFEAWLQSQGEKKTDIGTHAGISDTSQLMALNPAWIRKDKLVAPEDRALTGVSGNPARASVAYGRKGLELKVESAVARIRKVIATR
jgi:creatinine amidohydrolase